MQRVKTTPRRGWQKTVEGQGLYYHTLRNCQPGNTAGGVTGAPYWDESVYYHFESHEIDQIEECTYWLNKYCLEAAGYVINNDLFNLVGVPPSHIDWIKRSWERDEHTIYGRFDLSYSGDGPPKLLEFNADTPTGLLEASVIQWYWLQECHEGFNQYNSIHDRLMEIFKELKNHHTGRFHFAAIGGEGYRLEDNIEDFITVNYLRDVAIQAGWDTEYIHLEDIGWHEARRQFTDKEERTIRNIFKLYPWEWMVSDEYADKLLLDTANWWEPPWKMLLSNKAILPILWELYPDSEYILPASFDPLGVPQVSKPIHGREGSNISFLMAGGKEVTASNDGPYEEGPFIYQARHTLPEFDGNYPVVGSWLVNGYACGVGIREDANPITTNASRFVPHIYYGS